MRPRSRAFPSPQTGVGPSAPYSQSVICQIYYLTAARHALQALCGRPTRPRPVTPGTTGRSPTNQVIINRIVAGPNRIPDNVGVLMRMQPSNSEGIEVIQVAPQDACMPTLSR